MVTKATVLILDNDLGFAMWLGRALTEAGFRALPANTSEEALTIAGQMQPSTVHVVIANLEIAGSAELLKTLAAKNKSLKVIGIGPASDSRVDATITRPDTERLPAADRYIDAVLRVIENK